MTEVDRSPHLLIRRADAIVQGVSDGELARMVRRSELHRLQRGAYLTEPAELDRVSRHPLQIRATAAGLAIPGVVSHASTAAM